MNSRVWSGTEARSYTDECLKKKKDSQVHLLTIAVHILVSNFFNPVGALVNPLSPRITQALISARNIFSLYTHQAAAINAIEEAKNVVVSTSTASGKSVIYQAPAESDSLLQLELIEMSTGPPSSVLRNRF